MGVAKTPGLSPTATISKLLKKVFQMDRCVEVERSQRKLGDKPCVIIANYRCNYYYKMRETPWTS